MRFLSLFSGIEAASVAWLPLGWECVGFSEVATFPCAVLQTKYPNIPNLGDVTKITEEQIMALGHIDIVVGGFPCQDLSVAGKRKGLKNADGTRTRSGLFFDAMRVASWTKARYLLVENVPGLFSSNAKKDFAAMVREMAGCDLDPSKGGWENTGCAIGPEGLVEWCVLDAEWFGVPQRRNRIFAIRDSGNWYNRPPVLFERHSLQGHTPPSRKKGEGFTADVAPSIGASGRGTERTGESRGQDPVIAIPETAWALQGRDAKGPDSSTKEGHLIPVCVHGTQDPCVSDNAFALGRNSGQENVIYNLQSVNTPRMRVRRLTPLECERLMGFPDGYSLINYRGKPAKDSPRYKALGNSMVVPVMRWVGQRIEMVDAVMDGKSHGY